MPPPEWSWWCLVIHDLDDTSVNFETIPYLRPLEARALVGVWPRTSGRTFVVGALPWRRAALVIRGVRGQLMRSPPGGVSLRLRRDVGEARGGGRLAIASVETEPAHAPINQPLELDDDVRVARRVTPQLVGPNAQFRQCETIGDRQRIGGISYTDEQPRRGVVDEPAAGGVELQRRHRVAGEPRAAQSGWMELWRYTSLTRGLLAHNCCE